jgi:SAM-dependent methyltransferase
MKSGQHQLYSADAFELWNADRQTAQPYFQHVYEAVNGMLAGANAVLDVAGGRGHPYVVLDQAVQARTTTIDVDPAALADFHAAHPAASLTQADIAALPFADGSFGAAVSVSSFDSFRDTTNMAEEIERVLMPGGKFIFLRDTPYHLREFALGTLKGSKEVDASNVVALPMINEHSGDIDQFLRIPLAAFNLFDRQLQGIDRLTFDSLKQYVGTDWVERIYGAETETGTIALRLQRLLPTIHKMLQMLRETPDGLLTEPLGPLLEQVHRDRFKHTGLAIVRHEILVDFETDEPIQRHNGALDELYVDRLSNIRTKPKTKRSSLYGTRVHGRTPVYVATK